MNFEALEQKIEAATRKAFLEIVSKHKEEEIYAFALYSDDGAMTVCPASNSLKFLNNPEGKGLADLNYYKFVTAEWKYEMLGADNEFDAISTELYSELSKNNYENEYQDEKTFLDFRDRLFQACIHVLKKLKEESFFKNLLGRDIFLTFTVPDFDFEEKELDKIISDLNDNPYKEEYLAWMRNLGV